MVPTPLSPDLPSLETLPPERWVDAMHALRSEVAEHAATILDQYSTPEGAQAKLQALFDYYTAVDINGKVDARLAGYYTMDIGVHGAGLVFRVFPTRRYLSIVRTDAGYWWFDHGGADGEPGGTAHQFHLRVIRRLLEMIPWANDDTIDELAAIEIATRAG